MGFFHCRPISPADDFVLTSPTKIEELGDYRTNTETLAWYYCKRCAVRVFAVAGVWEEAHRDLEEWAGVKSGGGQKLQPVLMTKGTTKAKMVNGEQVSEPYHYLSVNAVTLEPSEDIDLRKWHEKGWVFYVGAGNHKGPPRLEKPYEGGMY